MFSLVFGNSSLLTSYKIASGALRCTPWSSSVDGVFEVGMEREEVFY